MNAVVETDGLTKTFSGARALDGVDLSLPRHSIIGLIGRNGSGKTTLVRHIVGLYLPTAGTCSTLGTPSHRLGPSELSRIGVVHQESRLMEWMKVGQHLRFVGSFYERWDRDLERRLLDELELDAGKRVGHLSGGDLQKLAVILAVCHRPQLLLLDEPLAGLDPIAREQVLDYLVETLDEETHTIVISSHILRDIERIVDRVVCLDRGRLKAHAALDQLQESYAEWEVRASKGALPERFAEPYVLSQDCSPRMARLVVRRPSRSDQAAFEAEHSAEVSRKPLNLEALFPLLLTEDER